MTIETVNAVGKIVTVDEEGKPILDAEGKEQVVTRAVAVEYDFGENLEELIELCGLSHEGNGPQVVHHHAKSNIKIALQNSLRAWVSQGLTDEQIGEKLAEWDIPSGQSRTRSKMERAEGALAKLSVVERKQLLADTLAEIEAMEAEENGDDAGDEGYEEGDPDEGVEETA